MDANTTYESRDRSEKWSGVACPRIDLALRELIDTLQNTGRVQILGSSAGRLFLSPYIYFQTDPGTAAVIAKCFREGLKGGILHEDWEPTGHFNGEYQLCFCIRSGWYEQVSRSLFRSIWHYWIFPQKVLRDLETLKQLVSYSLQTIHRKIILRP